MIIAIEGGGTKTRAWLARGDSVLAETVAGPANVHRTGTAELLGLLSGIIDQLVKDAQATRAEVTALSLGMAGVGAPADRDKLEGVLAQLDIAVPTVITTDAHATLVGATAGRGGVLLIAGTGSISYGFVPNGAEARAGGWGSAVGDEGSGYGLGRDALVAICRMLDGRRPWTRLADVVADELGLDSPAVLGNWIRENGSNPKEVAWIAPAVCRAAGDLDPVAARILKRGSKQLLRMVQSVHRQLGLGAGFELVLFGGLLEREPYYHQMVQERLAKNFPQARIRTGEPDDALNGCLLLAKAGAGKQQ